MKLYATIRKQSKYYPWQQEFDEKNKPIPFSVLVDFERDPLWPIRGGIGGCYAIFDVHLWIKRGNRLVMLPVHTRPV